MTPLWAFDVATDGSAKPAPDTDPCPPEGAAYRWVHCDLADPGLRAWAEATLPAHAARGILAFETRPRIDAGEDGILATLRGPNLNPGDDVDDMVSVRLWVTPKLVVTVCRRRVFSVDDLHDSAIRNDAPVDSLMFLLTLADGLIARIETVSLELDALTDSFEDSAYDDDAGSIPGLGPARFKVIKLHRHIAPQAIALHDLAANGALKMPKAVRQHLREISNRVARSDEELAEVRDRLMALAQHLDLVQTTRQGRNGYVLSAIAAIFLPLSFLTGLFGVNLAGIPGAHWSYGFSIMSLAMIVIGIAVYLILRWKHWL